MNKTQKICLLGATGSIGSQTLDLIRSAPQNYQLHSLAVAGSNLEKLISIIHEFKPKLVAVKNKEIADNLKLALKHKTEILTDLNLLASDSEIDNIIVAVVGSIGLEPTFIALKNNKKAIIANKETLVAAGELIQPYKSQIIPADSEHVALHQCLAGCQKSEVKTLYLTASGGPFYNSKLDFAQIKPTQALKHPTWNMGPKITIDSATLMNKGLEVIEATVLFGASYEQIEVLIHPQSLVHSLVEFIDGNILAQLGPNDMRLALQYALDWPERKPNLANKFLNLKQMSKLEFFEPDLKRFKCLQLAYQAGKMGKTYPAVLSAADEIAVELFLQERISFAQIPELIEKTLDKHQSQEVNSLEIIKQADKWAREQVYSFL